ncbi:hypothetical protein D9613_008069 [Agrocybe pediades]|uniref:Uncharacterized protein n=1 Tax=Agrocybe pediades TaxID=84607 RepID=A0A8H4QND2_9AGAR|nr:hypothetical protein D9613_008069 [Agrocybe pediades]
MSTIVQRPVSAMSSSQNTRRNSIEIIDVDSYEPRNVGSSGSNSSNEVEIVSTRGIRRPSQREDFGSQSREIINLVDDEDDDEADTFSARVLSGHDADRQESHRRYISPHPVTSSSSNPPPVPRVPPRFAGHTSFPFRRNAPSYPTPPVAANSQPFDFEQSPEAPPVAGPSNPRPQRAAAPRSRHVHSLGFGGALLSSNRVQPIHRQRQAAAAAAAQIHRRRAPQVRNVRTINGADFLFGFDYEDNALAILALSDYEPDMYRYRGQQLKNIRERELYQQHYTHPPEPEPGFTFDFSPPSPEENDPGRNVSCNGTPRFFPPTSIHDPIILDDDDDDLAGSSSSKARSSGKGKEKAHEVESSAAGDDKKLQALLVCANCLDPLILNEGLAPEEAENRRVWGLRCGHLIDAKCLNKLGKPEEHEAADGEKEIEVGQEESTLQISSYAKGKGKAKAIPTTPSPRKTVTEGGNADDVLPEEDLSHEHQVQEPAMDAPDTSIRSRLRSRLTSLSAAAASAFGGIGAGSSSSASTSTSTAAPSQTSPTRAPPAKRRRGGASSRRRASTKKDNKKVQETYEWKCPVPTCGRVHVSVKIDDVWGPEKERNVKGVRGLQTEARGAVAVFA